MRNQPDDRPLGAALTAPNRCHFRVWAPYCDRIELEIVSPGSRSVVMQKGEDGYHAEISGDCLRLPAATFAVFCRVGLRPTEPREAG